MSQNSVAKCKNIPSVRVLAEASRIRSTLLPELVAMCAAASVGSIIFRHSAQRALVSGAVLRWVPLTSRQLVMDRKHILVNAAMSTKVELDDGDKISDNVHCGKEQVQHNDGGGHLQQGSGLHAQAGVVRGWRVSNA